MISRTKFSLDESSIRNLFEQAGISGVASAAPLGDGEFNAVYLVRTAEQNYVLKIAPAHDAPVMTYEHNMMLSEVAWYDVLRQYTSIRVPEVYAADFSRKLLPVPYFIMEYMPGEPLNKAALSPEERAQVDRMLPAMAAQLHAIRSDRFGYPQNGLFGSWYDAIHAFVCQTLDDCERKKRRSRRGERLLKLIKRHRAVLEQVEGCMVNFDIWPANIIVQREEDGILLGWIDPERSFWGDRMLDFVCFAFHEPLAGKADLLAAYNAASDSPVSSTREEEIRFAIGQGYLALIMETEKYYRYSITNYGWWRNVIACRLLYRAVFAALD
jgi:aminoglycoside phosphotransferase (APT) family kinase protein